MRVKKLEIVGFKSFLEKASFDLTSNITGVVGPNGCGKSNIVDAIKWVTGELSFKELRGRSTEDLIFAGSELRPPTGMAEVGMVLDNSDGAGPPQYKEYSELSVMRRIFRDGTSEFFINKIPCRLRDIVDIFLDTGVGQTSYSIIEQGRVGLIVSSKPEDRREIIEEAAGITKFKHRKKAAERKMDYTKQNLLRVADVMSELKRQIGSLERQARKAERFKETREQARDLDVKLSVRSFEQMGEDLNSLEHQKTELMQKHETSHAEVIALDAAQEKLRLAILESERALQEAQKAVFEQATAISSLENRINMGKERVNTLRISATEAENRASQLSKEQLELAEQSAALSELLSTLEIEKVSLAQSVEASIERLAEQSGSMSEQEQALDNSKGLLMDLVAKEAELRNQKLSLERRESEVQIELSALESELKTAREELISLEAACLVRKKAMGQAVQLRLGFEQDQEKLQQKLAELRAEEEGKERELADLNQRVHGQKTRLAALEEFQRTLQGYGDGVRLLMEKRGSDGRAEKIEAILGEILEASPGYEQAVETVLSRYIECLVVELPADALKAVDLLKGEGRGRGAFLPSTHLAKVQSAPLPNVQGILGRLSDHVKSEDRYQNLVHHLLSGVAVVESLSRALEIWSSGNRLPMVTVKGDMITREGIIIGIGGDSEHGVLQNRREIEDLKNEVQKSESMREDSERHCHRLKAEIESAQAQLESILVALTMESKKAFDHEKDFERLEDALKRSVQSVSVVEAEQQLRRQSLGKIQTECQETSNALMATEKERGDLEADLSAASARLSLLKEDWANSQELLTQDKVRQASILEKIGSHLREKEGLAQRIESDRSEESLLAQSAVEQFAQAQEGENAWKTDEEAHGQAIGVHDELSQKARTLAEQHDLENQKLLNQEASSKVFREESEKLSAELSRHEIKLREETIRRDHLVEQVLERHGIALSSILAHPDYRRMDEKEASTATTLLEELRKKMADIGDVHLGAIEELKEIQDRFEFLTRQRTDLEATIESLSAAIRKINVTTKELFAETFEAVNAKFQEVFPKLFRGGRAKLVLLDPENMLETGVDIVAQPPGKRLQNMNLLSGGEKALTAIAMLFAIFQHKAPPFCLLDEVDAPLDDVNVKRFLNLVVEMSNQTQFILITHNKASMEEAKNLYGITMEEPGVSRTVSVRIHHEADAVTKSPSQSVAAA